jgi:hypothetical protein
MRERPPIPRRTEGGSPPIGVLWPGGPPGVARAAANRAATKPGASAGAAGAAGAISAKAEVSVGPRAGVTAGSAERAGAFDRWAAVIHKRRSSGRVLAMAATSVATPTLPPWEGNPEAAA